MTWELITSAPRDGRLVLLRYYGRAGGRLCVGRWVGDRWATHGCEHMSVPEPVRWHPIAPLPHETDIKDDARAFH